MTTLTYTLAALEALPDGRYPVHLYIRRDEPTNSELVSRERKAAADAERVLQDIIRSNDPEPDGDRLLRPGEMPASALPLFVFAIGASWDRDAKIARYTKIDYRRVLQHRKWTKVAALGMELYETTYGIIHKREKKEAKGRPSHISLEGVASARERFNSWADGIKEATLRRFMAIDANSRRATCERRHGDQCSPCKFDCMNFCKGGYCKEVPV